MKKLFLSLSVFSFVYGCIMLFTNVTKYFFTVWMAGAVGFFVIYLLYRFNIIEKIPKKIRKALLILSYVFIIILFFAISRVALGFKNNDEQKLDYLIVLGSHVTKDGPALATTYRLDTAYDYLKNNEETICVITGGMGNNEHDSEARVMGDYILNKGLESNRLILEEEASTTYENFLYSSKYMDIENDNIGIVTNNFHIYRSMQIAKKQGYKNIYGMPAYSLPINLLSNCLRESFALIVYKLTGRI